MPVNSSTRMTCCGGMLFLARQFATTLGLLIPRDTAAFESPPRAAITSEIVVFLLITRTFISRSVIIASVNRVPDKKMRQRPHDGRW